MSPADISAHCRIIIAGLLAPSPGGPRSQSEREAAEAGIALLEGFLINVARIADAVERPQIIVSDIRS